VDGSSAINCREVIVVRLPNAKGKQLWLSLLFGAIATLVAPVAVASGFVGVRDYTGVPVADLPIE